METVMERECSALGGLFQTVIGDMKGSYPVWDDFISKAGKLQSQLRTTVVAVAAFLDAFQKVADLANNSRGGTRDIGSALTRMCMRHRSIETKLRQFSMVFLDCLINPLQEQMEEWKRVSNTLDKDHAKALEEEEEEEEEDEEESRSSVAEYKKARQEIKKKSSDTLKLQKKAKKVTARTEYKTLMFAYKATKADVFGRGDLQPQLDSAMQDVNDKYLLLEETEKQAVRKALVEERARFCTFTTMLRPVVEEEMTMLGEITHLQTLTDDLKALTMDPHKLPASSEQVIVDLKGSECTWSYQTPPSSPSTTVSRKSSMCSSLNSVNSSDSRSSGSHCHSPTSHFRYRTSSSSSSALPQQTPARLSSVSSHDSGFISQDAYQSKSPSPMPPETLQPAVSPSSPTVTNNNTQTVNEDCSSSSPTHTEPDPTTGVEQLSNGFDHHVAPYLHGAVLQSPDGHLLHPSLTSSSSSPLSSPSYSPTSPMWAWSRQGSSLLGEFPPFCPLGAGMVPSSKVPTWKDWAKPGPYDQPMVNTLRRSKDRKETTDPCGHQGSDVTTPGEEPQRARASCSAPKQDDCEAHEELARALARGLQLDMHRCSRDSLQGSSGYSTQSTTPCCSEDTIPSQVSDCDYFSVGADQDTEQDLDKSCTIPRGSDIGQSYRRMFQSKRPASTAGIPSNQSAVAVTPGTATIRRTPSSKPNLRRPPGSLGLGPIPIKPPMIPVKTPTVPEHPGGWGLGGEGGNETPASARSPFSPQTTPLSPQGPFSSKATTPTWENGGLLQALHGGGGGGSDPPTPPPQPGGRVTEWERQPLPEVLEETECGGGGEVEDVLVAIRRGVKLKKTTSNDRSAPRIH